MGKTVEADDHVAHTVEADVDYRSTNKPKFARRPIRLHVHFSITSHVNNQTKRATKPLVLNSLTPCCCLQLHQRWSCWCSSWSIPNLLGILVMVRQSLVCLCSGNRWNASRGDWSSKVPSSFSITMDRRVLQCNSLFSLGLQRSICKPTQPTPP